MTKLVQSCYHGHLQQKLLRVVDWGYDKQVAFVLPHSTGQLHGIILRGSVVESIIGCSSACNNKGFDPRVVKFDRQLVCRFGQTHLPPLTSREASYFIGPSVGKYPMFPNGHSIGEKCF